MKYLIIGFMIMILHSGAWSQTYSSLGDGFNFDVRTLYYDTISSALYAGGGFWQTGTGDPMWRISKWNGTQWDSVGRGLDGLVLTITGYKGEIFAGGWFSSSFDSVGTVFSGLAKWTGTEWVKIQNDTFSQCCVLSLLADDNFLYVGGTFDTINSQPATGIAKYDGTNWYYYPPMPNVSSWWYISAIIIYNNELYVAGNFNGGPGLRDIMRFDGVNWISVGGGLSGGMSDVTDMKIYQNKLYIVGNLSAAAGDHGNGIAIWDGNVWSQAGSGLLPSTVLGMEEFQGELYVGGQIQSAGGIPVAYLCKWDGLNWNPSNGIIDNNVASMVSYGNDLYIGGNFKTVNGDTMNCITKYSVPVGIEENETHDIFNPIYISPNPSTTFINIQLNTGSINEIQIFDITGKLVLEEKGVGSLNCQIDVFSLTNGVYFIKVFSDFGISTEKLIIQKTE